MKRELMLPLLILSAVPFIMVLGNSMLIPVFPELESQLGLTQFQVGLLITAFSLPAGITIPFAGALSDHIGRKAVMSPALLLYGIGGLVAGFAALWAASPFVWIIVGRIIQGIGAGGTYQIALALTGDLFSGPERTRTVGILEAANGLGKVVSPVAGAALGLVVWFAPFFAYGILAIPVAFATWFLVKEPDGKRRKQGVKEYLSSLGAIFQQKGLSLLACYLAGAVGLFLLFGLLSFVSDELELQYGMAGIPKGLVLAIPVTVMTTVAYVSGLLLQDKDHLLVPAVAAGLFLTAASLTALAFLRGLTLLITFTSIMGLGIGSMLPALNTLITGASHTNERGLITALYGTVRFFGVALGPPAFGLVQGGDRLIMFIAGAGIGAVALTCVLLFVRPDRILVSRGTQKGSTGQHFEAGDEELTFGIRLALRERDHDPF